MSAGAQLAFGVEMARRGLWQEALFRFEQARRLESSARVLNNVAVAYEALGRFEEALATYREALAIAPGQADLKRNYSQFLEFYQGYQSAPGEATPAEAPEPGGEPEEGR
ncbi:MAG: tetratricopeptide repeat protein [Candidatus Rokubacteria bacterium]|nr:tetratricopeptide repeat protein [Candidatus Rokubacteria bacterium]